MKITRMKVIMSSIIGVAAIATAVSIGAWYVMAGSNRATFYPGTTLNRMNISELTVEEVKNKVSSSIKGYELTLTFRNEQKTITAEDIDMKLNPDADIEALKDEQLKVKYDKATEDTLNLSMDDLYTYDETALQDILNSCNAMKQENMIPPQNSRLVYDEQKQAFTIIDGESGTTLDTESVMDAVDTAIDNKETQLDADAAGLYVKPAFRSDSENAKAVLDEANAYLGVSIRYLFNGGSEEIIDKEKIVPWIYLDENQKIQMDHDKVQELVNTYAEKYNSSRVNMDFTTTNNGVISLSVPVSGESVDTNKLFDDILLALSEKASGDREVPQAEGATQIASNFGGNYIEVDLSNQKLYVYKSGSLELSSNIVSGSVSKGHMTPTGVYQIYSMEKDVTLRGADYASPVSFWMPFNGGVGFHDAPWKSNFGGDEYLYSGSHGCINMPYEKAQALYNLVNTGYYVIVHGGITYVPGASSGDDTAETERASSTSSETSSSSSYDSYDYNDDSDYDDSETTAPQTYAPETTPETTAPETTAPETYAPETTAVSSEETAGSSDSDSSSSESGSDDAADGDSGDNGGTTEE